MVLPSLDGNDKNKGSGGLPSVNNDKSLPGIDEFDLYDFDDDFEEVDAGDVSEDYDENEEIYQDINNIVDGEDQRLPSMNSYGNEDYYEDENDYNPDYEEDIENNKKRKFIDRKKKKLIPFGGNKSKRKVKSSDFDERKNVLAKTKILRFIIMTMTLLMFVFGLKNTFFPSHVYTDSQIKDFAKQGAGQTGFPRERGEAFVENFMNSYLTIDRTKPELSDILSYYYGEDSFAKVGYEKMNMKMGTGTKQHVIIGPTVYDVNLLTDYSALFKISAYVSDIDGTETDGKGSTGRWLSFAVNVYYDKEKDTMAITPDSPSIIPPYRIAKQAEVPERAPFGNGEVNTQIGPALSPTINGFVEAFARSSVASHESILQYIHDKSDIKLYDGFGGSVKLNGSPDTAIKKTIYNSDDGVYRVDLRVSWIDATVSDENNNVEYVGKYIMRITPEGVTEDGSEGKYYVSSFVPYTYYTK